MADRTFLDWPFFEPRHRRLADDLDAWAADAVAPLSQAGEDDPDGTVRALVRALGDAGWLRHAVPAPHGGAAERLDVRALCLIRETLARHGGLADFAFAMQGLGAAPFSLFGDEGQKARYLPRVAEGRAVAAFALSEADAGSDVAALVTTAQRDGGDYVMNGAKTWISNGGIADHYVVFARTGEGPGAKGLSAFIVDADTPGFRIKERIQATAPHPLASLALEDARVPAHRLIGKPGDGFRIAMATLDVFRATVGAAALGFARKALDLAVARAASRALFGGVLADLQMTQGALADMAVDVDAAALLVYRAAWAKDQGADRITREASMAKLHATEAAQRVIDRAVQFWGGLGVARGHPVEALYREIRPLRIYEGASEVQRVVIARQLLAAAKEAAA